MSFMRKILWIQKIMKRLTISSEIYKIIFACTFDGVWKETIADAKHGAFLFTFCFPGYEMCGKFKSYDRLFVGMKKVRNNFEEVYILHLTY